MAQQKTKKLFLILFTVLLSLGVYSQDEAFTEQDLINKAESLFDAQNWKEAIPLYAQLLSVYPENAQYNYKFGVCSLLGNRADSKRPVRYLNIAYRSMPENADLLFYLGLAYYQDQEFSSALHFFNRCLLKMEYTDTGRTEVESYISSCNRGMELLHKNHLDEVISKSEYQYDNFHRAYLADDFEGSLIQKPDVFTSNAEMKSGSRSFVYVSEPRGILYFSGYLDEKTGQRDIFKVKLNKKGEWGQPEKLSDVVNTPFDEDYPVVTDDGTTLYFSSKGHNSMGGYDVFKSTYDVQEGAFGTPENMGIGINSPFDDILFIPDNSGRGAYFASTRENQEENITVFRVILNDGMQDPGEMLAENKSPAPTETDPQAIEGSTATASMAEQKEDQADQVIAATITDETKKVTLASNFQDQPQEENRETATPGETSHLSAHSAQSVQSTEQDNRASEATLAQNNTIPVVSGEKATVTGSGSVNERPAEEQSPASGGLKVSWELVHSDEARDNDPSEAPSGQSAGIDPAQQVSPVAYVAASVPEVDEEELEIKVEADPVRQVQMVKYAAVQASVMDGEEPLEILLEPDPVKTVEGIAYHPAEQDYIENEELEITMEPDPVKPVQMVRYAAAQENLPEADESLEITIESDPVKQVEAVEFAFSGGPMPEWDEVPELTEDAQIQMTGMDALTPDQKRKAEELSALTASSSGLLVFPEPISVPISSESPATYAALIKTALTNPDALTYEDLLFAASMANDPTDKVKIYNASFIRSERDWRAYYNASVAARGTSNAEQAEVYLYQASLIYDDELVGQANPGLQLKIK